MPQVSLIGYTRTSVDAHELIKRYSQMGLPKKILTRPKQEQLRSCKCIPHSVLAHFCHLAPIQRAMMLHISDVSYLTRRREAEACPGIGAPE